MTKLTKNTVNGPLKSNYEESEIGAIPKDWEVKKLNDIGRFSKGQGISRSDVLSSGIPCIRYGELYTKHQEYIKDYYSFISKKIASKSIRLRKGDILFAGSGETKEEIGKCTAFLDDIEAYAGGDIVLLSPYVVDSLYLGYLLNSTIAINQKASKGQGDAVVHISANNLSDVIIPLPPTLEEQKAIATALSDTDALITAQDKLIAKKKAIKQGAMQRLLKPKEGWVMKKLGEIVNVAGGGTPSTFVPEYWNGNINWFTPTEVGLSKYLSNSKRKITKLGLASCSAQLLQKGAVLLTSRAGIGDVGILETQACTNQGFQSLVSNPGINNEFIYYLALTLKTVFLQNASGSTFLEISPGRIKNIVVEIPDYAEQTKIANILSDMDREINTLQTKLGKYKQIKKGMMQELLTGKTRLV